MYLLIFFVFQVSVFANSVLLPEGSLGWQESLDCYKGLSLASQTPLLSLSPSRIDSQKIRDLASDSANARVQSLKCLKDRFGTNSESLIPSYERQMSREFYFMELEWRILTDSSRAYPLTPTEFESAKLYFDTQTKIRNEIHNLTISILKEKTNQKDKQMEGIFLSFYGSLLREREKFLFSLSSETYNSYVDGLKKRQEKH